MVRRANAPMTVEDVRDNWQEIVSFAKPLYHLTQADQVTHIMNAVESISNTDQANSNVLTETFTYTPNQLILYALAVGCSLRQPNALRFLYENHENFAALPTFAVIPAQSLSMAIVSSGKMGIDIDLSRVNLL